MYFKIFIMCFVFIDIPSRIYSFKHPPSVKKQLEIITSKIQEHVATILQPLDGVDDARRAELKDFAKTISDTYNEMAIKLQIQIEGFIEKYATMSTDIEFGTMFNDPIVGTAHKEPSSKGDGINPTNPYIDDGESLVPMVKPKTTTPNPADEEDLYIPNEPTSPSTSPKSSEEVDGNNGVILFKTPAINSQGQRTSHLPLYYDGGKQQYYSKDIVPTIDTRRSKAKAQHKMSTKRFSSSEEERLRDQHEEKKLQEQKFRRRTSSEEDREKGDKDDNAEDSTPATVNQNKTPSMTSSEEEDLNPMTGKKYTTEMPADSSEEEKPSKRKTTKKRRTKKTTPTGSTKKAKRTTKRRIPSVKKVKKYSPTKTAFSWTTPTNFEPFQMYPEDSAKEEED